MTIQFQDDTKPAPEPVEEVASKAEQKRRGKAAAKAEAKTPAPEPVEEPAAPAEETEATDGEHEAEKAEEPAYDDEAERDQLKVDALLAGKHSKVFTLVALPKAHKNPTVTVKREYPNLLHMSHRGWALCLYNDLEV